MSDNENKRKRRHAAPSGLPPEQQRAMRGVRTVAEVVLMWSRFGRSGSDVGYHVAAGAPDWVGPLVTVRDDGGVSDTFRFSVVGEAVLSLAGKSPNRPTPAQMRKGIRSEYASRQRYVAMARDILPTDADGTLVDLVAYEIEFAEVRLRLVHRIALLVAEHGADALRPVR